jgi:hypothetical protein
MKNEVILSIIGINITPILPLYAYFCMLIEKSNKIQYDPHG